MMIVKWKVERTMRRAVRVMMMKLCLVMLTYPHTIDYVDCLNNLCPYLAPPPPPPPPPSVSHHTACSESHDGTNNILRQPWLRATICHALLSEQKGSQTLFIALYTLSYESGNETTHFYKDFCKEIVVPISNE